MNVSYNWLRSLAPDLRGSARELADRLAMYGAPVKEIVDVGAPLADVLVARVAEVGRHPNADRLSLCQVDAGDGELLPVVCGAPNVRAGRFYPFIPEGGELPGGNRIGRAKIRGTESRGMLCSARELGLGRDHEGILELGGSFTPGERFIEAVRLNDFRLDVEVTPNRPDLLSHIGIARELAPRGVAGVILPSFEGRAEEPVELSFQADERASETSSVNVRVEASAACPHYIGAVILGVRIGPSPEWLAARLRVVGLRPINNVVDATNWVLYELGQPLHAFDLQTLGGQIVVREARAGEMIVTLDGERREVGPGMLVIADATRPIAIAGVMGGRDTEVSKSTRDVFLECAIFDPRAVRHTRRALDLSTDASYRYERGVDPDGVERAVRRACELIQVVAGGDVVSVAASVRARPREPRVIGLRAAMVERVLGVEIAPDRVRGYLEELGFGVEADSDTTWRVEVPGHRSYDVFREVDLVEEVARRHGYDSIPDQLRSYRPSVVPPDDVAQLEDRLRTLLVGRGLLEARTAAFARPNEGDVELLLPLSSEESRLRRALLPGLVHRVEANFNRGARDIRLFELGTVFSPGGDDGLPLESTRLAAVVTGLRAPPHWSGDDATFDVWDLKCLAAELAEELGLRLEPGVDDLLSYATLFDPATCFRVLRDAPRDEDGRGRIADAVGLAGRLRDGAVDTPAWAATVWAFELDLGGASWRALPAFRRLPEFPAIERDIALLAPRSVTAARLEPTILAAAGELLEEIRVFDVYDGPNIEEGRRSIAFRLRFRARDRTLTDREIDPVIDRVLERLRDEHDVQRRA